MVFMRPLSTLNNIKLLNYPRAHRDLYGLQQGVMCFVITFLTHLGTEKKTRIPMQKKLHPPIHICIVTGDCLFNFKSHLFTC